MKVSQGNMEALVKSQEVAKRNNEASIKNMET